MNPVPRTRPLLVAAALAALAGPAAADGPARPNEPYVGYLHPAGGRVGTVFRMDVGGQNLRDVRGVLVSGEGVRGTLVHVIPPWRPLDRESALPLRRRLANLRAAALAGREAPASQESLPAHPLLVDLERKTLAELDALAAYFFRPRPLQQKRAIEETAVVEITIDPSATPGLRDLRLLAGAGLTNPLRFRVGVLPETTEDRRRGAVASGFAPAEPPVVFNGQILPKEVDRWRFRARKGQRLVLRAEARALVPFQADAVPGWMQPTLALRDAAGRTVAFGDDWRFDPDPVLFVEVPEDGEYSLEVADAIYRGREDFVYRVTVGEQPFVTSLFPLGGRIDATAVASVTGWNLAEDRVRLDTAAESPGLRWASWRDAGGISNEVPYALGLAPETEEREPNDAAEGANRVVRPVVVNGRIGAESDRDVFRFEGRVGADVVVETTARSLGSPVDTVVRLLDASGKVLAWNDDHEDASLGWVTHQADSYLVARLPRDGAYFVQVADAQGHGGPEHAYRLRISPPRPDVTLLATPSSVNVYAGRAAVMTVRAVRRDGYAGAIDLALRDAPPGFVLSGARIPEGKDVVRMTLTAPRTAGTAPVVLRLEGRFRIADREVVRPVVPAEEMMQAFAYRHLVPSQDFLVAVLGPGRAAPAIAPPTGVPLRIRPGGRAVVHFAVTGRPPQRDLRFALHEPPPGVTLGAATEAQGGLDLEVLVDSERERIGTVDNLIVEAYAEPPAAGADGAAPRRTRRQSFGVLPAIPLEVVAR